MQENVRVRYPGSVGNNTTFVTGLRYVPVEVCTVTTCTIPAWVSTTLPFATGRLEDSKPQFTQWHSSAIVYVVDQLHVLQVCINWIGL